MDYPDTDELNYAKDSRDLNEYCSNHELPYQDLDNQGMMTKDQDRLQKSHYNHEKNKTSLDIICNTELLHIKTFEKKSNFSNNSITPDSRETPEGFI